MTEPSYSDPAAWSAGPDRVYRRFAEAAATTLPGPLAGRLALDVGAGTGAMSRALARRGARTIAMDLSEPMLRAGTAPAAVADLTALPVAAGAVDVAAAAFVLSHLPDPLAGLAELARVTRPGGTVVATGFPTGDPHPVKAAADAVLTAAGYQPPAWYLELKRSGEAAVGTAAALHRLAAAAGLTGIGATEVAVDLSDLGVDTAVAWRLGMAQVAPYLAGLPLDRRAAITGQVRQAVSRIGLATPVPMLVLTAQRPSG